MRNLMALVVIAMLVLGGLVVYAAAPNAGDGLPDGSGYDPLPGPVGGGDPLGPAPNAGDGISDGSGLNAPHGAF